MNGFEPVKVIEVIVKEVGRPRNDGTEGCALYAVPFRLSYSPPSDWCELFLRSWQRPPRWTSMHRPGIASVYGDKVVLDGTTIEEVEQCHKETLKLAVDEANKQYEQYLNEALRREEQERAASSEHADHVRSVAGKIKFD